MNSAKFAADFAILISVYNSLAEENCILPVCYVVSLDT